MKENFLMKNSLKFFGFCLLLALGIVTLLFNSCSKDDNPKQDTLTVDKGVVINGVKWATRNVAAPGFFAANSEDAGMFYQWNRKIGWSAIDPMINSNSGTVWDVTVPTGTAWEKANDPSPAGWRVPTFDEIQKLCDTNNVTYEWIDNNGLIGGKFTDKAIGNSIFLPAAGYRYVYGGTLYDVGNLGYYWSSAQYDGYSAYHLLFGNGGYTNPYYWNNRSDGFSVRAVAD